MRVTEKGSQKFRPVVKTRPRGADGLSRQTSATPENNQLRESLLPNVSFDESSISTPVELSNPPTPVVERVTSSLKTAPVHVFASNPQSQLMAPMSPINSQSTPIGTHVSNLCLPH